MSPRRRANLINLLLLQLGCAGPLVAAALGYRELGAGLGGLAVVLAWLASARRGALVRLMLVGGLLGTTGEWLATVAGLMSFTHPMNPLPFPGWLPPSWALLGSATAYVLAPLRGRAAVGVVVGALVGAAGLYGAVAAGEIAVAGPRDGVLVSAWLGLLVAGLVMLAPRLDPARSSAR